MGCRGNKASASHLYVSCVRSTPLPAWQEERRAIKSTKEAAERALRWIWVNKVWRVGQCCWDTSQVLINLGWVAWVRFTEDVSPAQSRMYLHTIFIQLKDFMTSNISEIYQSGFRKDHSTDRDAQLWMAENFSQLNQDKTGTGAWKREAG